MRFFPRLLLSYLLVILLTAAALFVSAELLAPTFYREHVERMAAMLSGAGSAGGELRLDLESGLRTTLNRALLASLPLAGGVAILATWLVSRRLGRSVRLLDEGSRALAQGEYARRLPETGRDELTELARHFNVLAGALERVEQGRAELIGNVAHELRAPLAALRGYADATQDGVMTPEHAAQAISREVEVMNRLIRDLSLVSRVEAGQMELHLRAVAFTEVLRAVQERFAPLFAERGVALDLRPLALTAALPPVRADEERAVQVLTNLLSNALRHTPAGGTVTVDARVSGAFLCCAVADTGVGIAPAQVPRIFERFYRGDVARRRDGSGSGVGLTIARGLAEAMGGELRAASVLGEGSTFTFTLPLDRPSSPA